MTVATQSSRPTWLFWVASSVALAAVALLGLDGGRGGSAIVTTGAPGVLLPEGPEATTAHAGHSRGGHNHPKADPSIFPTGVRPARLVIPSIGVDASSVDLDLRGPEPEVPSNFADVGWYTQTRLPGEIGPSVIAGHIDSERGPAVFHRLDELGVGAVIEVHGADGQVRTFEVVGSGQYLKTALPEEVFGFGESVPELRLITCGGVFDRATGHYQDNYVVFAKEVSQ